MKTLSTMFTKRLIQSAILLSICCFISTQTRLYSQAPELSYMIPDIGAPGMNVYVEFYVPNSISGFRFSNVDGLYFNSNQFRIECVNPLDTQKVKFGPLCISWSGRLLSTIIFVNPRLRPNSSDYALLLDEFRIPIRFVNSNGQSNILLFYIVKPYESQLFSGTVLGQGQNGRRSPRGAMIVDSLIFNQQYTISANDTEQPTSNGNQGYLPFILMSRGSIRGTGSNASLSVNGQGSNGGVGGGGGAGSFCDVGPGYNRPGSNGGDGFTGGGRGGRNYITDVTQSAHLAHGTGTGQPENVSGLGSLGSSLNGTTGASSGILYEGGGGGTGHPFGVSGGGVDFNTQAVRSGGLGGATSCPQPNAGSGSKLGSGGGFGTDGSTGTGTDPDTRGRAHGNIYTVPIAGGSGGAATNPEIGCGGFGGGGGGSIRLVASLISDITVTANGADGGAGEQVVFLGGGRGGAGSGGHVNLCSYSQIERVIISARGGNQAPITSGRGGVGRVRIDGLYSNSVTSTPTTEFSAPTMLTLDTIRKTSPTISVPLTGYAPTGSNVTIYARSNSTNWTEIAQVVGNGQSQWSFTYPYSGTDTTLYFVCGLLQNFGSSTPRFVMSPLGAQALRITGQGILQYRNQINFGSFNCARSTLDTVIRFTNTGSESMFLTSISLSNTALGYSLIQGSAPPRRELRPTQTDSVIVRYLPNSTGVQNVDLNILAENGDSALYKIQLTSSAQPFGVELLDENNLPLSAIGFGDVCITTGKEFKIRLRNRSSDAIRVDSLYFVNPSGTVPAALQSPAPSVISSIAGNGISSTITLLARPQTTAPINDTLIIEIRGCRLRIPFFVTGQPKQTLVEVTPWSQTINGEVIFGNVRVGMSQTRNIYIKNTGLTRADIRVLYVPQPPFSITYETSADSLPKVLLPGDSIRAIITFSPTSQGDFVDTLITETVASGESCSGSRIRLLIRGKGSTSNIVPDTNTIDFGRYYICSNHLRFVTLTNAGNIDTYIKFPLRFSSGSSGSYTVNSSFLQDTLLSQNNSVRLELSFSADTSRGSGFKYDTLLIDTEEAGNPTSRRTIRIPIVADLQKTLYDFNPLQLPVNTTGLILQDIPVNQPTNAQLQIRLRSGDTLHISKVTVTSSTITIVNPTFSLPESNSFLARINLTVRPTSATNYLDTAVIYIDYPCPDTVKVLIDIRPIEQNLVLTPRVISLDTIQPCDNLADQKIFLIRTDPQSIVQVDSIVIQGDSKGYSIDTRTGFPFTMTNLRDTFNLRFNQKGLSIGPKKTVLYFYYIYNGQPIKDSVIHMWYRTFPVTSDTTEYEFGDVILGSSLSKQITLQNKSSQSKEFSVRYSLPTGFRFTATQTDFSIPGNRTAQVISRFTPDTIGPYSDTMYVVLRPNSSFACFDSIPIVTKGRGVAGLRIKVRIDTATIRVNPNDKNVRVGIYAKVDSVDVTLPRSQFRAVLSIPTDMYFVRSQNPQFGRINSFPTQIVNQDSIVRRGLLDFSIDTTLNEIVSDKFTLIGELIGTALLGAEECDSISIVRFDMARPVGFSSKPTWFYDSTLNGRICTEICQVGGSQRLIERVARPMTLTVTPNPAPDKVTMRYTPIEKGSHFLRVYAPSGQVVFQKDINVHEIVFGSPLAEHTIELDGSSLASGVYMVVCTSPTQRIMQQVILIK